MATVLCLVGALGAEAAPATDTSQGPAPADEAALLWEQGQAAHAKAEDAECVRLLQRLIDRHPAAPGALKARLLVSECQLRAGSAKAARENLKLFLEARTTHPDSSRARLLLMRAWLELNRPNEAALLAQEILKSKPERRFELEALVLKARTLVELGHDLRASQSLASFDQGYEAAAAPLKEEAFWVRNRIKLRACASLPKPGPANEGAVRSAFQARETCLDEAVVKLREAVETLASSEWIKRSVEETVDGISALLKAIESPLPKTDAKPGRQRMGARDRKLTKQHYETELRTVLLEDLGKFSARMKQRLAEWKKSSPGAVTLAIQPLESALP